MFQFCYSYLIRLQNSGSWTAFNFRSIPIVKRDKSSSSPEIWYGNSNFFLYAAVLAFLTGGRWSFWATNHDLWSTSITKQIKLLKWTAKIKDYKDFDILTSWIIWDDSSRTIPLWHLWSTERNLIERVLSSPGINQICLEGLKIPSPSTNLKMQIKSLLNRNGIYVKMRIRRR